MTPSPGKSTRSALVSRTLRRPMLELVAHRARRVHGELVPERQPVRPLEERSDAGEQRRALVSGERRERARRRVEREQLVRADGQLVRRPARSGAARTATRRTPRPTAAGAADGSAPRARSAARSAASGSGGSVSHQCVETIASPPRGRSTRASSGIAAAGSNQWNASPTKTASTLASVERNRLGAPRERRAVHRAHALVRLDGDDVGEATLELAGQPAGAGREVEDARVRVELQSCLRRGRAAAASTAAGRGGTSRRRFRS